MPVGNPSDWGRAPRGGRDLNILLSELAELSGTDVALPVAATLAGLWACPAPAELAGEAAARAMFQLHLGAEDVPERLPEAPGSAGWAPDWVPVPDPVDPTLVDIPPVPAYPAEVTARVRPPGRPVRRRRRPDRGRPRVALVTSLGVAAVAVGAVALASTLPGPASRPGSHSTASSAAQGASASGTGSQRVFGAASPASEPTRSPVPTTVTGPAAAPATSPGRPASSPSSPPAPGPTASPGATSAERARCTQFFAYFTRPEPPSAWDPELKLFRELSEAAGGAGKIYAYCAARLPAGSLPGSWPSAGPASWPTPWPTSSWPPGGGSSAPGTAAWPEPTGGPGPGWPTGSGR